MLARAGFRKIQLRAHRREAPRTVLAWRSATLAALCVWVACSSACAPVLHIARWTPAPFNVRAYGTGFDIVGDPNSPTPDATDDIVGRARWLVSGGANPTIARPGLRPVTFRIAVNERLRVQPAGEPIPTVRLASRSLAIFMVTARNPWAGLESVGVEFARWRAFDATGALLWTDAVARTSRSAMPVSSGAVEAELRDTVADAIAASVEPRLVVESLPLARCGGDARCTHAIEAALRGDYGDAERCAVAAVRGARRTHAPWLREALTNLGAISAANGEFANSVWYFQSAAELGDARAGAMAVSVERWRLEASTAEAQGMPFEPQLSGEGAGNRAVRCE